MANARMNQLFQAVNPVQNQNRSPAPQLIAAEGSDRAMADQQEQSGTLREMLKTSLNTSKSTTEMKMSHGSHPVPKFQNSQEIPTINTRKPNNDPVLPPCKVCGAKASGIHFGAVTCEACKVS